jgi:hypothetical protein
MNEDMGTMGELRQTSVDRAADADKAEWVCRLKFYWSRTAGEAWENAAQCTS